MSLRKPPYFSRSIGMGAVGADNQKELQKDFLIFFSRRLGLVIIILQLDRIRIGVEIISTG